MTGFASSGGKSDGFDAFVLCELARTDHHRFRVLEPDSDATKALRALTRATGRSGRRQDGAEPTSCGELSGSGPGRLACSAICTARSRSRSWSAIPAPRTRAGSARRAFGRSWRASATPGGRSPRSYSRSSGARRRAASASAELATRRQLVCAPGRDDHDAGRADQPSSSARSPTAIREHPDGAIFPSLFKGSGDHRRRAVWPRSATAARATPPVTRWPATPARPPSRSSRASAKPPAFAGAATSGCARRSAPWPTAAATGTPGRKTSTPPARARGHDHPRALRTLGRAWCTHRVAVLAGRRAV